MNFKLAVKWVAVLTLGGFVWVAFTGHSPFDFVGMIAAAVCAFFVINCVERATGRTVLTGSFVLVVIGLTSILKLLHVSEIASTPIALILGWKSDGFLLRYRAAKAIREINEKDGAEALLRK